MRSVTLSLSCDFPPTPGRSFGVIESLLLSLDSREKCLQRTIEAIRTLHHQEMSRALPSLVLEVREQGAEPGFVPHAAWRRHDNRHHRQGVCLPGLRWFEREH